MKKPLHTIAQTAQILNVSVKTIRRLITKGDLRSIKIGGRRRIDPVDLQDFIRDHRSR
jgi:excisionase family DNA binding protein